MSAEVNLQEVNNHRKLGRELGLFMFSSEVGSGLPLWLPKGAILRDTLERFLRQEQLKRGYLPVMTPHIGKIALYKTSGHWYKYRDSMFPPMVEAKAELHSWTHSQDSCSAPAYSSSREEVEQEGEGYMLKPMNCPHHIQIYKHEMRSYRELPLRLAEFGMVYRFEQSGELNGLLRTRDFTVDDSHIFVPPEGVEAAQLKEVDVRVEVDMRRERMNAKVRDAQMQKIPYMLVIGDREMAEDTVSVRLRTNENWGEMSFVSFLEKIMLNVKRKSESL